MQIKASVRRHSTPGKVAALKSTKRQKRRGGGWGGRGGPRALVPRRWACTRVWKVVQRELVWKANQRVTV